MEEDDCDEVRMSSTVSFITMYGKAQMAVQLLIDLETIGLQTCIFASTHTNPLRL
jgi:HKD family nuclease